MSEAVYQPTTVTYENNGTRWPDRPISYLASTVTEGGKAPCVMCRGVCPIAILITWVTCLLISIILFMMAALRFAGVVVGEDDVYFNVLNVSWFIFLVISAFFFVIFLWITKRWCWATGKDRLDIVGSPGMTLNPSTDLLVTAQYAPVSEVAYQPTHHEDSEQCKLMSQESKDSKDDTDCMIERDPRIVLRPLNQPIHEET